MAVSVAEACFGTTSASAQCCAHPGSEGVSEHTVGGGRLGLGVSIRRQHTPCLSGQGVHTVWDFPCKRDAGKWDVSR